MDMPFFEPKASHAPEAKRWVVGITYATCSHPNCLKCVAPQVISRTKPFIKIWFSCAQKLNIDKKYGSRACAVGVRPSKPDEQEEITNNAKRRVASQDESHPRLILTFNFLAREKSYIEALSYKK